MADETRWRIGGPAEYFCQPTNLDGLLGELDTACGLGLPIYVLSRGTNVLIDDRGLPGLVVSLRRLDSARLENPDDELVAAGCGVPMPRIAVSTARWGLAGFEFLGGIPGAIGAGIAINAGVSAGGYRSLADVLVRVAVVNCDLEVQEVDAAGLELGYRHSRVPSEGFIVVSALLRATGNERPDALKERLREHLASRSARQPIADATAGSVFKQPEGGQAAGWYLDRVGMKDYTRGGARVSTKHANWIVNLGGASADDIRAVMSVGAERVQEEFGVELIPEVVDLIRHPWRKGPDHERTAKVTA